MSTIPDERYELLDRLLKLPAGRELDRAIAELVFGATIEAHPYNTTELLCRKPDNFVWALGDTEFSADISAAWQVVEKLRKKFSNVNLCADNGWALNCWNTPEGCGPWFGAFNAETAPLAICRTAIAVALGIPSSVVLEEREHG